jgi:hypothetical protein
MICMVLMDWIIFRAINKDLNRTRPEDPYFQKPANIKALKEISSVYCSEQQMAYQQGLLDVF